MTVLSVQDSYSQYTGTGDRTFYEYGFEWNGEPVNVRVNGRPVGYTQQANGIVLDVAPAVGDNITIARETPITQETDFRVFGPFDAAKTEDAMDKLILLKQESFAYRAKVNLYADQQLAYTDLVNDTGTTPRITLWNEEQSGVFSGEVTETPPAQGSFVDKPEDFVYFFYGSIDMPAYFKFGDPCGIVYDETGRYSMNYTGDRVTGISTTPFAGPVEETYFMQTQDWYWRPVENSAFAGTETFMWTGWVYVSSEPGNSTAAYVLYRGTFDAFDFDEIDYRLWCANFNGDVFEFFVTMYQNPASNIIFEVASPTVGTAGSWYFFSCYYDAENNEIGLSATRQGEPFEPYVTTPVTGTLLTDGERMQIGSGPSEGSRYNYGWNGYLNEFAFWREVLPQAQVEEIYNNGDGISLYDLPFAPLPAPPPAITTNYLLMAWWKVNEPSGDLPRDDSYGYNELTQTGAMTAITGVQSNAVEVDGTDGVGLSHFLSRSTRRMDMAGSGSFSIAGWVKFDTLPSATEYDTVVARADQSITPFNSSNIDWQMFIDGDTGSPTWRIYTGRDGTAAFNDITHPIVLSTGTWYFFAIYFERSTLEMGISITEQFQPLSDYQFTDVTGCPRAGVDLGQSLGGNRFSIGRLTNVDNVSGFRREMDGAVDEIGYWWRKLSFDTDLPTLYNSGNGVTLEDIESPGGGTPPTPVTADVWVAPPPLGSDSNPGTAEQPLATLAAAQTAVRALPSGNAITVMLRGGEYQQTTSLALTALDSGEAGKPVTWKSYPNETALIHGGQELDPAWFTLMDSGDSEWSRLPVAAQNNVYKCDLGAQGIIDYGTLRRRGARTYAVGAAELFVNRERMQIARWPKDNTVFADTFTVLSGTVFTVEAGSDAESHLSLWENEPEKWYHGYPSNYWADQHLSITSVNPTTREITVSEEPSGGFDPERPFYVYNVLTELSQPGEYYLERSTGILYYWPDGDILTQDLKLSMPETPLISASNAEYIEFRDLQFGMTRQHLVEFVGNNPTFHGCTFFGPGNNGLNIDGYNASITECDFSGAGDTGLRLLGGDRPTLTSANHLVENCTANDFSVWSWASSAGIMIGKAGVSGDETIQTMGATIRYCEVFDGPITGILSYANEVLIQLTDVHDVCKLTVDQGAIYTGNDWSFRDFVVDNCWVHDIQTVFVGQANGNEVHGVYADDCVHGVTVKNSYLVDIGGSTTIHGGGRDCVFTNNLQIRCRYAHRPDSRGWQSYVGDPPSNDYLQRIIDQGIDKNTGVWASTYPTLAAIPDDWSVIELSTWSQVENSVFDKNNGWDCFLYTGSNAYGCPVTVFDQYETWISETAWQDNDPQMVDYPNDLTIQADIASLIPGWVNPNPVIGRQA